MSAKPRLKGSWQTIPTPEGVLWLVHELSPKRLKIADPDGLATCLVRRADGSLSAAELVERVASETGLDAGAVAEGLASLARAGLMEDASLAPPPLREGYYAAFRRNANYLAEFEAPGRTRFDMLARLSEARVAVLGLGGTGSWVLASLLAAGVGNLRGADVDTVGPENLGRQILYRAEDVGKPKAQAMADEIARFNPAIRFEGRQQFVRTPEDVRGLIDGCDFLVVGCVGPRFTLYRSVNEACVAAGVPYLIVSTLQVGPLVVPGVTSCHACYEGALRNDHAFYDTMVETLDVAGEATERMPQFGPLVAASATRAGLEVVRHLTGAGEVESLGTVLQMNGLTLEWKKYPIARNVACRVCSKVPEAIAHA